MLWEAVADDTQRRPVESWSALCCTMRKAVVFCCVPIPRWVALGESGQIHGHDSRVCSERYRTFCARHMPTVELCGFLYPRTF